MEEPAIMKTPITPDDYLGAVDVLLELCEPHERLSLLKAVNADLAKRSPAPTEGD